MFSTHSILYLLFKGLTAAAGLASVAIFTRMLSPFEYGIFSMTLSGMTIMYTIFFQWISLSFGRFYQVDGLPSSNFFTSIAVAYILSFCFSVVIIIFLFYSKLFEFQGRYLIFATLLCWSFAWYDLNLRYLNASLKPLLYGMLSSSKALIGLASGMVLYQVFGVAGVLLGIMFGILVSPVLWMRGIWIKLTFGRFNWVEISKIFDYGLPLAVGILLTIVVDISDRFLISFFLNASEAGLYSASYDLVVQILGTPVSIIYLTAFPLIINNIKNKKVFEAKFQFRLYGTLLAAITAPFFVIFCGAPEIISHLALGPAFRQDAVLLMPVLAAGIFIGNFKIYFFDLIFQFETRTRSLIYPALLTAISNIGLNIFLIPIYGIIGAAYGTVIAFAVGTFASAIFTKNSPLFLMFNRDFFTISIAAGLMFLALMFMDLSGELVFTVGKVFGSFLMYAFFLLTFNVANSKTRLSRYK